MTRSENEARLDGAVDIVVIGGGATGLGVAVDAAARGYRTLLLEARDFAQGTSSRSTKLIHGGVRYLRQGNPRLVREALHERERLLRNAPHLVFERRFLVPAYAWWERPYYGAGLGLYDLLAGRTRMAGCRVVGRDAAESLVPTIAREGLRGGIVYSDGQFDDARLAICLALTAYDLGAALLNHAPVVALTHENDRTTGVVFRDDVSGAEHTIRAGVVVNATGVFSDAIRRLDTPGAAPMVAPSQGIHLVLDGSFLPGETAIMAPRTEDGRVVFLIPWQGRTLVGTTDTPVDKADPEPAALEEEISFLLEHAGRYLSRAPSRDDVLSVFAGLRPLVKSGTGPTAALARDHAIEVSPSGLVTVAGGKWTTYRQMAEETVDRAARVAGLPSRPCRTATLLLHGADTESVNPGWMPFGASPSVIAGYERRFPGLLHPDLPYSRAMVAFAIENEMPVRLEDVLSRRLRALILNARAAVEAAPCVAGMMAALHGKVPVWERVEVRDFMRLAHAYLPDGRDLGPLR